MALDSGAYRALRRELRGTWAAAGTRCWLCGQAIDYSLPAGDPGAFELDHKIPRKQRPDLELDPRNCAPTHLRCNRSKGASVHQLALGETTEDW
ncbi:HNH endonuclease [Microbacterium sp. C7(2022)]|uniref:HNH endonuclease n=1 Tax=Microbacterium sp. C7(2022) TaxID=2992759 RepID=UPI00237B2765|nr:HNH endonuclease [Microbacterium sp. C7(2022)]MDE0545479.1 HNH endonuclease [Microbacterium sp. C7(2022)]